MVLSGESAADVRDKFLEAGAAQVLLKPASLNQLKALRALGGGAGGGAGAVSTSRMGSTHVEVAQGGMTRHHAVVAVGAAAAAASAAHAAPEGGPPSALAGTDTSVWAEGNGAASAEKSSTGDRYQRRHQQHILAPATLAVALERRGDRQQH